MTLKMLRQFFYVYVIKHQAYPSLLEAVQESFQHTMNINDQFAIPVMLCGEWCSLDIYSRPPNGGIGFIIQRPAFWVSEELPG